MIRQVLPPEGRNRIREGCPLPDQREVTTFPFVTGSREKDITFGKKVKKATPLFQLFNLL